MISPGGIVLQFPVMQDCNKPIIRVTGTSRR